MAEREEICYWVALHAVPEMGPVTFRRLLDRFGSARAVIEEADDNSLAAVRGVTQNLAHEILCAHVNIDHAERTVNSLRRRGVSVLRMTDPAYPFALHDLDNPPPLIYVHGEIGAQDVCSVAMVGTTKPSDRGRVIADGFATRFAAQGVTVVSGYAHGIDAASHRGAFRGGGRSILCIPHGIRRFRSRPDFPALADISHRGAVVSECPPDQLWSSAAAVSRNRLIAALGRALFVVETRQRGGTLHTVKAAQRLRRPIFVLKYRQAPDSARGNAILIARGGTAISRFAEIGRVLDSVLDREKREKQRTETL